MNLWTSALDLIFPPRCPFCRRVLEDPRAPLCPACQPNLPWLGEKASFRKVEFTEGCWSPLEYRDGVRECIHRYKFTPTPAYGEPLGKLMAQCVQDHPEIQPDLVTWAPLSRKRLRQRGFDQAEGLAKTVGKELGLPVLRTLNKTRHTPRQSDLEEKAARRANALGAYSLYPEAAVQGKWILLVDDVITSGSTLEECASILREHGAAKVWCLTLAQAGK